MKIKCYLCFKILKEKGAIILSTPHKDEEPDNDLIDCVTKYHICKPCWDNTLRPYLNKLKVETQKKVKK